MKILQTFNPIPSQPFHKKNGAVIGALSGFFNYARTKQPGQANGFELLTHVIYGALGGAIGGVLPDIIEPAYHSPHRKSAHSVSALAGVATLVGKGFTSNLPSTLQQSFMLGAGMGYCVHLVDDSATPRGLPLM